ncbi:MAG: TPM domain-containing protein, partial [Clostridia bacterium]|nr:TPM domain-containing protein [Clostridia bacterium]
YADDYFDYNGFGKGQGSGILLLISPEERDWAVSTAGSAIDAFTENGLDYLVDKFKPLLSAGAYSAAVKSFAETSDELLTMYENGNTFDRPQTFLYRIMHTQFPLGILLAAAAGFLFASVPMLVLRSEIENVSSQKNAANYIRPGSLQLRESQDTYLYTNTQRTKVESSSSSSSRGGSSTHHSSSGATHGGRSGKF